MNNIIENNEDQVTNGQVSRDLRVNSDATESETQRDFEASGRYANPMGTLHGAVLCDLADAAMGVAYRSTLPEGETFTTSN